MFKLGSVRKLIDALPKMTSRGGSEMQRQLKHGKHASYPVHIDSSNMGTIMSKYDTFLLDCDGVLWRTDHVTRLPGVAEAIAELRQNNKKILFVSNNSMHSRDSYCRKFTNFAGFDVDKKDVFTVTHATALYLKHILKVTGTCYMIGGQGMARELDAEGIAHFGIGPDPDPVSGDPKELLKQHLDKDVEVVLVAFDPHFNYNKIYKAASYLMNDACHYVATNDIEGSAKIGPMNRQPVTGALVAAVNFAGRRQPLTVGKPHKHLMECILTEYPDIDLSKTIMIGDSLKTDIAFARAAGIDSALVLTGASTLADLDLLQQNRASDSHSFTPDYILDQFSDFATLVA